MQMANDALSSPAESSLPLYALRFQAFHSGRVLSLWYSAFFDSQSWRLQSQVAEASLCSKVICRNHACLMLLLAMPRFSTYSRF